jgi:hypothetical protein
MLTPPNRPVSPEFVPSGLAPDSHSPCESLNIAKQESSDPTHQQEASCSWLSEYSAYVHYVCMGYMLGGTNDAIGVSKSQLTATTAMKMSVPVPIKR